MKRGLVVGKFYPPHNGHHFLIDTALEHAEHVDVLVCDNPAYTIDAQLRASWLRRRHPHAHVRVIRDIGKDNDSQAWAEHTIDFLGYAPDVVFSSEDYGLTYAGFMGAAHHMVDRQRVTIPIAATKIRSNVFACWEYLHPIVRQYLSARVCILGAESTGTTTLSRALAQKYHTAWVPEYGRYYTEALNDRDHQWLSQEFTHIAQIQQAMENQLAGHSSGLLICDTNAFATRLWHKRYMDDWSDEVDEIAQADRPDLYILTGDEIPFVQDGIRDGEAVRHDMHKDFIEQLNARETPYIELRGDLQTRISAATKAIDHLLTRKAHI